MSSIRQSEVHLESGCLYQKMHSRPPKQTTKWRWTNYSKENSIHVLSNVDFNIELTASSLQWNIFENIVLSVIDELVPLVPFLNNKTMQSTITCPIIKSKLNPRKKLLTKLKIVKSNEIRNQIRNLNVKIKRQFHPKKQICTTQYYTWK